MVLLIKDPAYCMFYHRGRVQELLPTLAKSHLLVTKIEDVVTKELEAMVLVIDDRDPTCVERWPECEDGKYDPRCCRFPKSCSCSTKVSDDTTETTPIQSPDGAQ